MSEETNAVTTNPEDNFDNAGTALNVNEEGQQVNGAGEETLIANADDASKVDAVTAAALELDEEAAIAAMTSGNDIRDTETVPTADYIITIAPIRPTQDVKFVYNVDPVTGKKKIVREKYVGFRFAVHYSITNKQLMKDNFYQMCHMAGKTGVVNEGGRTQYKQICANAAAAFLSATSNPDATMEKVMKLIDAKGMKPIEIFNQYGASTEDNMRYFHAKVKENPARDGYPASNELVIGSIKHDNGLYLSMQQVAK